MLLDIGIVTPVTLCMAITVLLVRVLNPEGASNSNTMRLATAYYDEKVREHWTRTEAFSSREELSACFAWGSSVARCEAVSVGAGVRLRDNQV